MPPNRERYFPTLSANQILNLPELPPPVPIDPRNKFEKLYDSIIRPLAINYKGPDDVLGSADAAVLPVAPMIKELLERHKLGDKVAKPAFKTIKKFVDEKLVRNPYWGKGELVPTSVAKRLREVNRNITPKHPEHLKTVEDYIMEHGIDDMGILSYSPERRMAHLSEGNTRTTTAGNLQLPFVPLRGWRSNRIPLGSNEIPVPNTNPFAGQHFPSEFKPSDLGFDVFDTDELIDIILRNRNAP